MSRLRIRSLKPDCWGDEKIRPLSRDARLLFVVLLSFADDDGRFRDLPAQIIGHGYPEDTDVTARKVGQWMDELAAIGVLVRYEIDGKGYGTFPNWHKHQRINRWTRSELPRCPAGQLTPGVVIVRHKEDAVSVNDHGEITEDSVRTHDKTLHAITEDSHPDREYGVGSVDSEVFRDAVGKVEEERADASNGVDRWAA
jgi:hypothetical protein